MPETQARYRAFWSGNSEHLRRTVEPWRDEYTAWPEERVYNGWFECGDAELYYAMIRTLQPKLIIEVGSGFCTRFAVEACQRNGTGRMICIDPLPRTDLPDFVRFEKKPVQQVDLRLFEELGPGDILFIDTSHEGEETLYHPLILDRVAPGVTVHHHDFAFPYAPDWPEENIIISYYMNRPGEFAGLVSNAMARDELGPEGYAALFPNYARNPRRIPGSIWTRRVAAAACDPRQWQRRYEETKAYAARVEAQYAEMESRIQEMEAVLRSPARTSRTLVSSTARRVFRRPER
jgi:hypothetical protein